MVYLRTLNPILIVIVSMFLTSIGQSSFSHNVCESFLNLETMITAKQKTKQITSGLGASEQGEKEWYEWSLEEFRNLEGKVSGWKIA